MLTKIIKASLLFTALIVLAFVIAVGVRLYHFSKVPIVPSGAKIHYILQPGGSIADIADLLHSKGYLDNPHEFILITKLSGNIHNIKAGEYLFVGPLTSWQLLQQLIRGEVVTHKLTIIEGWTFKQMLAAIATAKYVTHDLNGYTPEQIMEQLKLPAMQPEGIFFPATYHYQLGTTDKQILLMAYSAMQQHLAAEWKTRAANLPYTNSYQALIVASLIEKETSVPAERALVAGVILKRLQKNMYLQVDPTVIYGLGANYDGMITKTDLKTPTPYNTYTNKGLPPTPIALPGLAAIHAALHPKITDALFYVATGDGGHYFSATLQGQDAAIKKYEAFQAQQLSKQTLPLNKATIANDECWYLPDNLQFICPMYNYE